MAGARILLADLSHLAAESLLHIGTVAELIATCGCRFQIGTAGDDLADLLPLLAGRSLQIGTAHLGGDAVGHTAKVGRDNSGQSHEHKLKLLKHINVIEEICILVQLELDLKIN